MRTPQNSGIHVANLDNGLEVVQSLAVLVDKIIQKILNIPGLRLNVVHVPGLPLRPLRGLGASDASFHDCIQLVGLARYFGLIGFSYIYIIASYPQHV